MSNVKGHEDSIQSGYQNSTINPKQNSTVFEAKLLKGASDNNVHISINYKKLLKMKGFILKALGIQKLTGWVNKFMIAVTKSRIQLGTRVILMCLMVTFLTVFTRYNRSSFPKIAIEVAKILLNWKSLSISVISEGKSVEDSSLNLKDCTKEMLID